MNCKVSELIGSLQNVEELFIHQYPIQYLAAGGSPNTVTKPLQFLKTLSFSGTDISDVSVLSCLLCLIRSGPNLSKLQISALTPNDSDEVTEDECLLKDWKDCTIGVQTVVFKNLKGLKAEMQLVKFLLAHCPFLERMVIHWSGDIDWDTASTMQGAIWEFPTLTPSAQFTSTFMELCTGYNISKKKIEERGKQVATVERERDEAREEARKAVNEKRRLELKLEKASKQYKTGLRSFVANLANSAGKSLGDYVNELVQQGRTRRECDGTLKRRSP